MTATNQTTVLVIGAGIMGAGIAQVAAQAGHPVFLFDLREGAAGDAKRKLGATLDGLVAKGKLAAETVAATLANIEPIARLDAAAAAGVVVEAIVENLDAKRSLFRALESLLSADAILCTNTSSISVTAIANGLEHPGRVVGMHFFNPVPLMKLVEVVHGLLTAPDVADRAFELARSWGKVPVHARSTPGFIVNRIARPYYAEALALLQEQATTPQVLDACLRAAGFRMGPCELMDLIGHDTNFAVTRSVFEANFGDKRYVPSLIQREMVDGGLLGRKSGRGFYGYPEGTPPLPPSACGPVPTARNVTVHGAGPVAQALVSAASRILESQGGLAQLAPDSPWIGIEVDGARLMLSDGTPAHEVARRGGLSDVVVFDLPLCRPVAAATPLAYSVHAGTSASWQAAAASWLQALGYAPQRMQDAPGLIVARTVAMLINEAADAVQQGVCTPEGADAAMKLGVNYPAGPFEWLAQWSGAGVIAVVEALDAAYRGERYRVSPWLRRRAGIWEHSFGHACRDDEIH
ncbi:MAG: 3-hydroxyacyl-CoA dehydrogenase [Bradyrhizobium sp.]|nr:3-hydroxyacyl-CoA dehydrogenase [Burkholderiales bacterium]MBU6456335.1 3-hydroxyacyl-CoA dehydrogenase [Bradyrhizobium sp.]MDE2157301.1 3-hydroxyacyl-CoA dehydrogenase [Burkholderiales bacterium]MDE2504485.1 3-hydroxyacyl-CoA dehydrogenase [Burkholderiales bacterium]